MTALSSNQRDRLARRFFSAISLWGLSVAISSYVGLFSLFPLPWFALLVALGITLPLAIYYRNSSFRAYIQTLHLNHLTLFHIWRIPAAFIFFYYGSQQWLPSTFVRNAAWGDLAAGLLVFVLLALPKSTWKYWGFHLFGLADFVTAVGTGLVFALMQVPTMETIATFPVALIPLFGVGISGASHIMALDILVRQSSRWRRG
ncbi:MAG: hypothetical protein Fur0046_22420 [Cyanobacteria bacterium J069]|nr:MAG: hypothetical protein D6742_06730 [Cyanobacteria bacterium J069]